MHGMTAAIASALLFGAATPAAKLLLRELTPFQLSGLLYLGAAVGIAPWAVRGRRDRPRLAREMRRRLCGVILFGGIAGPVLLLLGLRASSAGSVSLLLNIEVAATALLATVVFGETLGARGWLGVGAVLVAGAALAWGGGRPGTIATILVAGACICWGVDNNLTALIDGMSPSETTLWKAGIAGATNLAIGATLAPVAAPLATVAVALGVGAVCYGLSIALYVTAAHHEGAVRTQAVFAAAPFAGAVLSWLVLQEPVGSVQILAGALFAGAVVLLALDRHAHAHVHEPVSHTHSHRHDDGHHDGHHGHASDEEEGRHTHWHDHGTIEHTHPHVPDLHHRHKDR